MEKQFTKETIYQILYQGAIMTHIEKRVYLIKYLLNENIAFKKCMNNPTVNDKSQY